MLQKPILLKSVPSVSVHLEVDLRPVKGESDHQPPYGPTGSSGQVLLAFSCFHGCFRGPPLRRCLFQKSLPGRGEAEGKREECTTELILIQDLFKSRVPEVGWYTCWGRHLQA